LLKLSVPRKFQNYSADNNKALDAVTKDLSAEERRKLLEYLAVVLSVSTPKKKWAAALDTALWSVKRDHSI
jgi:hypothetical protein